MSRRCVMIMAGGTGGHVFPGLAVARRLEAADQRIVWLGTRQGLESRVVTDAGIGMEWISVSGLRGKGWSTWMLAPLRLLKALWQSISAIRRQRPAVVLGMGGFVSGPGGLAAWLLRRPLLIHEQNAVAGLTNRILSRIATEVYEAFPSSFPASVDATTIGNPVRPEIVMPAGATSCRPHRPDPDPGTGGQPGSPCAQPIVAGGACAPRRSLPFRDPAPGR